MKLSCILLLLLPLTVPAKDKPKSQTPLERHVEAARAVRPAESSASPGSAFTGTGRYADLSRDFRASAAGDIITIVVADRAAASSRGSSNSRRESSANGGVNALGGVLKSTNPLTQIAGLSGNQESQGQGETTRNSTLSTTVSARVVEVLPNGDLVVEGAKETMINSERQVVEIRGVVRWNDLTPFNQVRSDRLAQLEVRVNGRGVVGDAVRRPNFLYRLLLNLLPF
mgnify:CR=1 FL=1